MFAAAKENLAGRVAGHSGGQGSQSFDDEKGCGPGVRLRKRAVTEANLMTDM